MSPSHPDRLRRPRLAAVVAPAASARSAHNPTGSKFALALLAFAMLGVSACRGPARTTLRAEDYPGVLLPATDLPVEAVWQQRVTARWQAPGQPPQERGFDAAVQRIGDRLTVVGLSPMGSVGFTIEHGPEGVEFTNRVPDQMAIPPRFILLDVQRAFFPWFDGPADPEETRSRERDGEQITERWQDGRLVERTFARVDGAPEGEIRVRYRWGDAGWAAPLEAVLHNGWFGYELTIETIQQTLIPAGAGA